MPSASAAAPPGPPVRSATRTSAPASAALKAAVEPAAPKPTTMTSVVASQLAISAASQRLHVGLLAHAFPPDVAETVAGRPPPSGSRRYRSASTSPTGPCGRRRPITWRARLEHGVEHRLGQRAGEGVLLARVVRAEQDEAVRAAAPPPGGRTPGAGAARSGQPAPARRTGRARRSRRPGPTARARASGRARSWRARRVGACSPAARSGRWR